MMIPSSSREVRRVAASDQLAECRPHVVWHRLGHLEPALGIHLHPLHVADQDVDDELAGHFGEVAVCVIVAAT